MSDYINIHSVKQLMTALLSALIIVVTAHIDIVMNFNGALDIIRILIITFGICMALIVSRKYYYLENGKRENLKGRVLQLLLISAFGFLLMKLSMEYWGVFYHVGFNSSLLAFFLIILSAFEIIIAVIYKLIDLVK